MTSVLFSLVKQEYTLESVKNCHKLRFSSMKMITGGDRNSSKHKKEKEDYVKRKN